MTEHRRTVVVTIHNPEAAPPIGVLVEAVELRGVPVISWSDTENRKRIVCAIRVSAETADRKAVAEALRGKGVQEASIP